jgi:hypothetical protein
VVTRQHFVQEALSNKRACLSRSTHRHWSQHAHPPEVDIDVSYVFPPSNSRTAQPLSLSTASPHSFSIPLSRKLASDHSTTSRRIDAAIMSNQDVHPESTLPLSKRRRVTRACDNCKSRKRRCNGEKPCAYCTEHRALCTYNAPYTRGKSDNVTVPVSRDAPTSPRGLSRWPHLARHSVASTNTPTSPHNSSLWPRSSLVQPAAIASEDDERAGTQSSRARSPIGGEGAAPMGQYLGPTSPFSVGKTISLAQCITDRTLTRRTLLYSTLRKKHK